MLIYEYKLDGNTAQYSAIDEAIRIVQFIRNKSVRLWQDERGVSRNDLQCNCAVLAQQYPFVAMLNSQARQTSAERARFSISRFYEYCKNHVKGKKGYPQFQHNNRSVEYKTTGWKLDPDSKHITFTDGCNIGRLRMIGTRDISTYPVKQIQRVRLLRRADGYYVQFAAKTERHVEHVSTGKSIGIDMGLKAFLTTSEGESVAPPRYLRKAEKHVKRLHRSLSRKQKQGKNRKKAQKKLAKAYLKVQRQREDFARKTANALIISSDMIAYEDLKICNMVKNHRLAKSIHDASWGRFLVWLTYYGVLHSIPVVKVAPHSTSQECSACGTWVHKTLSVRTHVCPSCGLVLDRDHNAAVNILAKAKGCTVGQTETDAAVSA